MRFYSPFAAVTDEKIAAYKVVAMTNFIIIAPEPIPPLLC